MGVMTGIALGTAGASLITQLVGQSKQAKAAQAVAESSAQQQEWNARIAEVQAQDAVDRGREAESQVRTATRGLMGAQRTGFAGQGLDISVGSPVDVQADAAYLGELDALQVRANAAREAWGYKVEAADRRLAADVARRGGQAQATAARWGMASTALGAASSATLMLDRYGWGQKKLPTDPYRSSSGRWTGGSMEGGAFDTRPPTNPWR